MFRHVDSAAGNNIRHRHSIRERYPRHLHISHQLTFQRTLMLSSRITDHDKVHPFPFRQQHSSSVSTIIALSSKGFFGASTLYFGSSTHLNLLLASGTPLASLRREWCSESSSQLPISHYLWASTVLYLVTFFRLIPQVLPAHAISSYLWEILS